MCQTPTKTKHTKKHKNENTKLFLLCPTPKLLMNRPCGRYVNWVTFFFECELPFSLSLSLFKGEGGERKRDKREEEKRYNLQATASATDLFGIDALI